LRKSPNRLRADRNPQFAPFPQNRKTYKMTSVLCKWTYLRFQSLGSPVLPVQQLLVPPAPSAISLYPCLATSDPQLSNIHPRRISSWGSSQR